MFRIKMADLLIDVENQYDFIREKCADYITEEPGETDLVMKADEEAICYSHEFHLKSDGVTISDEEAEYSSAHYKIYPYLAKYDALWLHSAVVERDGGAYAFTAPSGYGKSTHVKLWLKAFGDQVRIINGDNPIIRWKDDGFYIYGTPFCGKEGYQINTGVPLKGICFLWHDEKNAIQRVDPAKAMIRLMRDNWTIPEELQERNFDLYAKLVENVPAYLLKCNQDVEAAQVAWEGMR